MKIILKKKTKTFECKMGHIPVYGTKVCLLKYSTEKGYLDAIALTESLGVKYLEGEIDDLKDSYGFVSAGKCNIGFVVFVFLNLKPEYSEEINNTLGHENTHLVDEICDRVGLVKYANSNNEHLAYLTGYTMDLLVKFVNG